MQMTEYLHLLKQQIRCKKAHPMIEEEYKAHIEDQAEAYMQCGMEKEEAIKAAVAQMGDPVEAGVALDGIHRPKMCKSLLVMIAMLTLIGIISQALIFKEVDNAEVQQNYLLYTMIYNFIGFAVMFAVCYLDYSFFSKHITGIYLCWNFLMFAAISEAPLFAFGGYYQKQLMGYQLLAFFTPIFAMIIFRYRNEGMKGFLKTILFLLPAMMMGIRNGKLTGCIELYVVALILYTTAFLRGFFGKNGRVKIVIMWIAAILLPILIITGIICGSSDSYRMMRIRRLQVFLNPATYAKGEGFIATNIAKAVEGLNPFGGSIQVLEGKLLPNTYNDFILLSIFHYFGIVIGIVVCLALMLFFIKAFRISFLQKNQLAKLIGVACATELLVRALIYALTNFGVCPFTQMNMPFLSFGLLGTLTNSILTGLLLSVYRYENVLGEKQMNTGKRYRIRIEKVDLQ